MFEKLLVAYLFMYLKDDDMKEELAGTTAICVLIKDKKIYCVS